jgi:hypothetical protein
MQCLRDENLNVLFSNDTVNEISKYITQGIRTKINKYVIVPNDKIYNVLGQMFERNKTWNIGNIYSSSIKRQDMMNECINDTIQYIVTEVSTTLSTESYYQNLSKWDSILGTDTSGDKRAMQSHSYIKLNKTRTHHSNMGFMRY